MANIGPGAGPIQVHLGKRCGTHTMAARHVARTISLQMGCGFAPEVLPVVLKSAGLHGLFRQCSRQWVSTCTWSASIMGSRFAAGGNTKWHSAVTLRPRASLINDPEGTKRQPLPPARGVPTAPDLPTFAPMYTTVSHMSCD